MCKNATDNKQGYCNLAHSQTSNFIQVGAVRGHNLASNANRIDFNKEIAVDLVVCLLCCHVGQALILHNRCEHDIKKDSTIVWKMVSVLAPASHPTRSASHPHRQWPWRQGPCRKGKCCNYSSSGGSAWSYMAAHCHLRMTYPQKRMLKTLSWTRPSS